jgi:UDP-glucose 4-epimerase
MRVLVTGGCGFIGSHLVGELSKRAFEVEVFDNLTRTINWGENGGVRLHRGDIRDQDALRGAMRGVDVVYHLAAQSNVLGAVHDMDYAFSTNVVGTYNVLTCARDCGVRRLIFTSSREVYGEVSNLPVDENAPVLPKNVYGATKAAGELLCRSIAGNSLQVTVLRLANVYGPGDRDRVIPLFVEQALRDQPLTIFGKDKVLDFVWIGDVIAALVHTGFNTYFSEPINIGSGRGTTLPELARQVLKATGSRSVIQQARPREVEVDRFVADITRARHELSFDPAPPLLHLQDVVEGLLERKAASARVEPYTPLRS